MKSLKIVSVNTSEKNGTIKTPAKSADVNKLGIKGDSHAGNWHRQLSLLGMESYAKVNKDNNLELEPGAFAENITTEGMILHEAKVFDRFECNEIILEVTQIGKKCNSGCEIQKQIGNCIMPVEGIFSRVIQGGTFKAKDIMKYIPKQIKVQVITMSDRAFSGEYSDRSGPQAEELLTAFFETNGRTFKFSRSIVPDRQDEIKHAVRQAIQDDSDIIITTGGTGIGPKDITPDVIRAMLDKEIPGIMEHIRVKFGSQKPNALISRSIAGVIEKTLIYVLPGSVKAVNEYMSEITPTIEHSMRMIHGIDSH